MKNYRFILQVFDDKREVTLYRSNNGTDDWEKLEEDETYWLPSDDAPLVSRTELDKAQGLLETLQKLQEADFHNAKMDKNGRLLEARLALETAMSLVRCYLHNAEVQDWQHAFRCDAPPDHEK